MKSTLPPEKQEELARMLNHIAETDRGFIPEPAYIPIHQIVPWPTVEVGLLNNQGELLLHYRHFPEWPGKWSDTQGWYTPGGYILNNETLEESCKRHLKKDGVSGDIEFIGTCGVIKFKPGQHPFSCPISILCICLPKGEIKFINKEGEKLEFHKQSVTSPIPRQEEIQELFFSWRDNNVDIWSARDF